MKKIILLVAFVLAIKIILNYLEDRPLREFYRMQPKPFARRYSLDDIARIEW